MKKTVFFLSLIFLTIMSYCNAQKRNGHQTMSKQENVTQEVDTTKAISVFLWEKIDESRLGACYKITKTQLTKLNKVYSILFKEYSKLNEYDECLEFVYDDVDKYSSIILDFITVERICCPSYTFYIKFYPDNNKVSLIVGGTQKIKTLAKGYVKE